MNNFTFNEKHYLQIQGTAMGTRVAPTYANIYMNEFEEKHVYSYKNPPKYWFRFIDDIWSVIDGDRNDVDTFITHLNTRNDRIRFMATVTEFGTVPGCGHSKTLTTSILISLLN